MDEEALEILRMIRDGHVTPEEGAQLLDALKTSASPGVTPTGPSARFIRLRVNVTQQKGEDVAVNMNLPVSLADLALKMAEHAQITHGGQTIALGDYLKDLGGMDMATILQMVKDGAEGKLMDVNVNGEDEKVRVEVVVD